jgi:hypothetical protein
MCVIPMQFQVGHHVKQLQDEKRSIAIIPAFYKKILSLRRKPSAGGMSVAAALAFRVIPPKIPAIAIQMRSSQLFNGIAVLGYSRTEAERTLSVREKQYKHEVIPLPAQ